MFSNLNIFFFVYTPEPSLCQVKYKIKWCSYLPEWMGSFNEAVVWERVHPNHQNKDKQIQWHKAVQ